jgi:hypothetical protein
MAVDRFPERRQDYFRLQKSRCRPDETREKSPTSQAIRGRVHLIGSVPASYHWETAFQISSGKKRHRTHSPDPSPDRPDHALPHPLRGGGVRPRCASACGVRGPHAGSRDPEPLPRGGRQLHLPGGGPGGGRPRPRRERRRSLPAPRDPASPSFPSDRPSDPRRRAPRPGRLGRCARRPIGPPELPLLID